MNKIGIICEYNPFHNGHLYHINKIKELYPDSIIILVLNGYFTERGEVSLLSKEDKTKIALENNIDIVLELPVIYGTQSADTFAYQSVAILNSFNVSNIIFGSECNDISKLELIAKKQNTEEYNTLVKKYLDTGINYPTALAKALEIDFDFNNPNDLLGISYIKAILSINSNIKYETIKRTSDYHDINSTNSIVSASNIREKYMNNEDVSKYTSIDIKLLNNIDYNLMYKLFRYQVLTINNLEDILSVDEGIDNRIKKYINSCSNFDELTSKIKTKRYTYNKINRMYIHILLGIRKNDNPNDLYIKILGFNNHGKLYLNSIKKDLTINNNLYISELELRAAYIYNMITGSNIDFEIYNKPIIKNQ